MEWLRGQTHNILLVCYVPICQFNKSAASLIEEILIYSAHIDVEVAGWVKRGKHVHPT